MVERNEVLIVEDSMTQALLLRKNLEDGGFVVRVARDGCEALQEIAEKRPHLVISDIEMPRMNGFQLSRTIKDDPDLLSIPIILLTHLSHPQDLIQAMQSGADSFIIKPYEEEVLFERMENMLQNQELFMDEENEPMSLQVFFAGERHHLKANQAQMIHLLLSTFEAAIEQNARLMRKEQELWEANKKTEEAYQQLKASTIQLQKLSQAVEQSPASVIITDYKGEIQYVNPRFCEITGYSSQEVLGKNPNILKSGHHTQEFYQNLWSTITRGEIWQGEICNRKKDGELYWEAASIAPLSNEQGEVTHFVAVREDITERRQREEEFRVIIETALDGFWIMDLAGRFLVVNEAYCQMTGYSKKELLEMNLSQLEVGERRGDPSYLKKILQQGMDRYETLHRCKDRSLLNMEVSIQFSTFRGGTFIVFARDITERKKGEAKLKRYLQFQQMVTRISTSFVYISLPKIQEAVHQALQICGHFFQVKRIQVLQLSSDGRLVNTHTWTAPDISRYKEAEVTILKDFLYDQFFHEQKELFLFSRGEEVPFEAGDPGIFSSEVVSFLSIPITTGEIMNLFCFERIQEKKTWQEEDLSLLKIVVKIISNVFLREQTEKKIQEYTRQMEQQSEKLELLNDHLDREIEKAKHVHESTLLKTIPQIQGLTFAVHYQPAQRVGGDFYFSHLVGDRLVLYLSDVSGHGLDGAMLSLFVKNTINAYLSISSEEEVTPEKILQFVTQQFHKEDYPQDYFICIYLMVLELKSQRLHYLGTGFQDTPLLKRQQEELQLKNSGLPISTALQVQDLNFKTQTIQLTPGTTLFFNTDGLTEQWVEGEIFGGRIKDLFFQHVYLPPEALAQRINLGFREFNNGSLQGDDDITFMILQINPPEQRRYIIELQSSFDELENLRKQLFDILPSGEAGDFFAAGVHELAANAMEHGNQFQPHKKLIVEIQILESIFYASVEDMGQGFNWQEAMGSSLKLGKRDERGRGLSLTQTISRCFFYNDKGNKAYLVVDKKGEKKRDSH